MKKKKYLKPQVDVAQTGPCMMINRNYSAIV